MFAKLILRCFPPLHIAVESFKKQKREKEMIHYHLGIKVPAKTWGITTWII